MSGYLQITTDGRLRMGDGAYPYQSATGTIQQDCPCPECMNLQPRSITTCKSSEEIAVEYHLPAPTWTAPEASNMCLRLLMWTGFYYDHATTTVRRRSDDVAITASNYTYCWRMASWCGVPNPNGAGRETYVRPACPPAVRPWSCACWDYSDCVPGDPLPISRDSFIYTDTVWQESGCALPTNGSNPLFDPIWAEIVSELGASYDGYSIVIHILVSTDKWASHRTDIREWNYPEIHGYSAVPLAIVFPPNSPEACEWEGISDTYDTGCT